MIRKSKIICDLVLMWFCFCKFYIYGFIFLFCFDFGFFGIVFDVFMYNILLVNVEVMILK